MSNRSSARSFARPPVVRPTVLVWKCTFLNVIGLTIVEVNVAVSPERPSVASVRSLVRARALTLFR